MNFDSTSLEAIKKRIAELSGVTEDAIADYAPEHESELSFQAGKDIYSVFPSEEAAVEFYEEVYEREAKEDPAGTIDFLNNVLGDDRWLEYISKSRMTEALLNAANHAKNKKQLTPDTLRKIKETPFSVLRSFFDMTTKEGIFGFYSLLLSAIERQVYTDAARSIVNDASFKTSMNLPSGKRAFLINW